MEEPRQEKKCIDGHLILVKEMWKHKPGDSSLSICQHYKIEQDLTGELLKGKLGVWLSAS